MLDLLFLMVVQALKEFDNIVLLRAPSKVGVEAIQVVLTSSEEDKNLLVV